MDAGQLPHASTWEASEAKGGGAEALEASDLGYEEDSEDLDARTGSGESESGTDEEEERRQYGIRQCLPVDDAEPDWEAGEPASAEEYLRRVRWEAAQLPAVVVAEGVALAHSDEQPTGYAAAAVAAVEAPEACPPELQPSPAWVRGFLASFGELRRQLQWECELGSGQLLAGGMALESSDGSTVLAQRLAELHLRPPSQLMPELRQLAGLDQVEVVHRACAHLRRVVGSTGLSPQDAAWLYAYSARIEKPLHADTCALYRALLRHCARLRAGADGPADPLLPHLNILISIAGGCFGQDEELARAWEQAGCDSESAAGGGRLTV